MKRNSAAYYVYPTKDTTNFTESKCFQHFFYIQWPYFVKVNHLKTFSLIEFISAQSNQQKKVHKLIPQLNKGKALGPLRIPVIILKNSVNISSVPLSFIINEWFEQGKFPESLKTAQVIVRPSHYK